MLVDPRTFRRVVHVRQRILANDDATIRELAHGARMSASRLIRVFAALFGQTPHRLRTRVRLDRARELLAGGAGVTSVCMEVGFSSVGSFSALFTRHHGGPPSRYRESLRAASPLVPGCLGMMASVPRNFREAREG